MRPKLSMPTRFALVRFVWAAAGNTSMSPSNDAAATERIALRLAVTVHLPQAHRFKFSNRIAVRPARRDNATPMPRDLARNEPVSSEEPQIPERYMPL